jgi:hypothetical protein
MWQVAAIARGNIGEYSSKYYFHTGPICDPNNYVPPLLLYPSPGEIMTMNQWLFECAYPEACFPDQYVMQASTSPDFSGPETYEFTTDHGASCTWSGYLFDLYPEDCTRYYWRVAPQEGLSIGPYSSTGRFATDFSGNCPWSPIEPIAIAHQGVNCRVGASESFAVTAHVLAGEYVSILGKIADGSWLQVGLTGEDERICWVNTQVVEVFGSLEDVPFVIPPESPDPDDSGQELPPEELPACSTLGQSACEARADCEWVINLVSEDECKDR